MQQAVRREIGQSFKESLRESNKKASLLRPLKYLYDVKNYADLGGCFQPWWTTILHGLQNSSHATQPHSIIAKYQESLKGHYPLGIIQS